MQNLLDRFKATGRLSTKAHRQLSDQLDKVRRPRGGRQRQAGDAGSWPPSRTLADDAGAGPRGRGAGHLIRDADAMIVRLGGTASKAGVRANDGKPVNGAGRARRGPHPDLPGPPALTDDPSPRTGAGGAALSVGRKDAR